MGKRSDKEYDSNEDGKTPERADRGLVEVVGGEYEAQRSKRVRGNKKLEATRA